MTTAQEWEARIRDGQRRLQQLRKDMADGVDEAEAAHRNGFATRNDVNAYVESVIARHEGR